MEPSKRYGAKRKDGSSSSRLGATLFRGRAMAVSADARVRSADWMAVTAPGPQPAAGQCDRQA
jgi:hypothetical protein